MKIEKDLLSLNQENPNWSVVNHFLKSSQHQYVLVDFLKQFSKNFQKGPESQRENIAMHGLRILGSLGDERVIPFVVEFLYHSRHSMERDFASLCDGDWDSLLDKGKSSQEKIFMTCRQTLELLTAHPHFLDKFWSLYKMTLDPDVAREFLGAAIQCNLGLCGPHVSDRVAFRLRPRLRRALLQDFESDPFFGAYNALMTLDTRFLPLLENVMADQWEFFWGHFSQEKKEDDLFLFWGQIPLTWFILREVERKNYQEITAHIKMFLFNGLKKELKAYYPGKGVSKEISQFRTNLNPKKDRLFQERFKQEMIGHLKRPPKGIKGNNILFMPKSRDP